MSIRNEPRKRRVSLWVAGSIVAVAVLAGTAGVIGLAVSGNQQPSAETEAGDEPSSPSQPSDTPVDDGSCHVEGGMITTVPNDLAWETVSGVSWPTSPSLGPLGEADGFPVCFSHSPVGAALAAYTIQYEGLRAPLEEVGAFYLVESPGRETALAEMAGKSSASLLSSITTHGMTVAGFRVDEYSDDRALVYMVLAVPNSRTGYRGIPSPLVWVDGDWRMKVLDTGSTGQPIDVLEGQFTRWAD